MDGEHRHTEQHPPLSRRGFLQRAGGAVVAATALGAGEPGEKLTLFAPKGLLALIGGATSPYSPPGQMPREEMQAIATKLGIDPEKLTSPKHAQATLTADELEKMAEACDPKGIFREIRNRSSFKGKTVIYVACGTQKAEQSAVYNDYLFRFLGAGDVIAITSQQQANLPALAAKIRHDTTALAYFGPGDQTRLASLFNDTLAHRAIHEQYLTNERFTVMGNSAGAAAMPGENKMIHQWNEEKNGALLLHGLGFAPNIIVETHTHRDQSRLLRLQHAVAQTVARGEDCIGLALDEGTGIVIKDGKAAVIGLKNVWKITADHLHLLPHELEKLQSFTSENTITRPMVIGQYAHVLLAESILKDLAIRTPGR